MLSIAIRAGALVIGSLLVVLGVVGIFLPFLQGFLLIALGLSVLSMASERVARRVESFKEWARAAWRRRREGKA